VARANETVAELLQEYSELISMTGGEDFKARVYEKAARAVEGCATDVSTLDEKGLCQLSGVGKSIAGKILEFRETGRVDAVEALRAQVPPGVLELTRIPTLGPKKAMRLYEDLGVASIEELRDSVQAGKLEGHRGFGERTAENILHGIELLEQSVGRALLSTATTVAEEIVERLSAVRGARQCMVAGSLRRMKETIGDVDVLVATAQPRPVMSAFTTMPEVTEVVASGPTKSSIRTAAGLPADLRVVPPEAWGAALQYFTGSKPHNVALRAIAQRRGLKLSEYGLFEADGSLVASQSEEQVYGHLGLPWIPPTLREARGEIEAAQAGRLPDLVTVAQIKGDLHTHTNLTDGVSTLEEMVDAAAARGYEYYAVTDHAKDLPMQRMTEQKMRHQCEQLRAISGDRPMALLHGTELNIDPDGNVDWGPDVLAGFDICVASIHSHFTQDAAEATRRLIRACENPYISIIGHLTTRLLGKRPPIDADFDAIFATAARTGTALEVNSFPDRLDLNDELILRARDHGVVFAINTDAHASVHLDYLRYGVGTAQRGWLTPDEVINTWPLPRLQEFIADKRPPTARRHRA
jgi:DNA polymerase (family 10)